MDVTKEIFTDTNESLYMDALYAIIHQRLWHDETDGPEVQFSDAVTYLRDAFAVSDDRHVELLVQMHQRPPPETPDTVEPDDPFMILPSAVVMSDEGFGDHCRLITTVLRYELALSQTPHHAWCGEFSHPALRLLSLHASFRLLSDLLVSTARWVAFAEVHRVHPIQASVFERLLDGVMGANTPAISHRLLDSCWQWTPAERYRMQRLKSANDVIRERFWAAAEHLCESLLTLVRGIHEKSAAVSELRAILQLVKRVGNFASVSGVKWNEPDELLREALADGASEQMRKKEIVSDSSDVVVSLRELTQLVDVCEMHIRRLAADFGATFSFFYRWSFVEHLYRIYDLQLALIVKPLLIKICNVAVKESGVQKDPVKVSTAFFELNQRLFSFSDQCFRYSHENWNLASCSEWFKTISGLWLEVARSKVTRAMNVALEKANFKPEFEDAPCSSAAIDAMQLFYTFNDFFVKTLRWRDVDQKALMATELCLMAEDFLSQFLTKLKMITTNDDSDHLDKTLMVIVDFNFIANELKSLIGNSSLNTTKKYEEAIEKLLREIVNKKASAVKQFMLRGGNHLVNFYDDLIKRLSERLSPEILKRAREMFWSQGLSIAIKALQENLIIRDGTFAIVKEIFECESQANEKAVEHIERLIEYHGLETSLLIHQYFKERESMRQSESFGILTVFCYVRENELVLKVLNARNLITAKGKKCTSYVKVSLTPWIVTTRKTRVLYNTNFPLFDEVFSFELTPEKRKTLNETIVYFSVKNKNLLKASDMIGEAFLSLANVGLTRDKQNLLQLTRTNFNDHDSLKVLQCRAQCGDQAAYEFLRQFSSDTSGSSTKVFDFISSHMR